MKHVSEDLRGAIIGFVVLLSKGLLDDDRWEWDIEEFEALLGLWGKCSDSGIFP